MLNESNQVDFTGNFDYNRTDPGISPLVILDMICIGVEIGQEEK